jgi:hypothetical protein
LDAWLCEVLKVFNKLGDVLFCQFFHPLAYRFYNAFALGFLTNSKVSFI